MTRHAVALNPFASVQYLAILFVLDEALSVQALAIPRYHLHPLKGKFKGYWSVTVKANWRIIFRFEEGRAYGVELIDYH